MVRLAISVEGQTEEHFVNKVMVPHLEGRKIYALPLLLGRTGGDVSLSRVKKELNSLARSFDKVTTLYDFYGFRGKDEAENKETLEQKILNNVARPLRDRIIPYVQMYEFEGLLFSFTQGRNNHHEYWKCQIKRRNIPCLSRPHIDSIDQSAAVS